MIFIILYIPNANTLNYKDKYGKYGALYTISHTHIQNKHTHTCAHTFTSTNTHTHTNTVLKGP